MSGKRSAKLRQVVKENMARQYDALFNALCEQPLRKRLRIALCIVMKRKA